jgi:hypothetical protein
MHERTVSTIVTGFRQYAGQPEPAEFRAIRLAWEDAEDLAA